MNVAMKKQAMNAKVVSFNDIAKKMAVSEEPTGNVSTYFDNPSCEVFPFRTDDDIKAMVSVFDKQIEEAKRDDKRMYCRRDRMMFLIGINLGIRSSDLRILRWNFFFNADGSWKESYKIQPKKTRKHKKYVTLYFNDVVKAVIEEYLNMYPYSSLDDYVFASRKGDDALAVSSMRRIIKNAAKEAGIKYNVGTHSLRKTFAHRVWMNSDDRQQALVLLQYILNHSSSETTLRYIGVSDEMARNSFGNLNLGMDFI